ncbi:MAG TPA: pre-peptidase C-terminal domain-containing protein [Candidatus Bathyarchaeia archaeon]|nr:pre-peptidase C-terminal domain-containing protein [Candidatus Bathyarchaeia archaeon]
MKGSHGRLIVCLFLLIALLGNATFGASARDTQGFIEEYLAWMENEHGHIQMQLDKKYDEVEIVVSGLKESDGIQFEKTDRLSFEIEGLEESVWLQIRAYDSKQLAHTALYRVGLSQDAVDLDEGDIEVEKARWKKEPSGDALSLQLVAFEEVEKSSSLKKQEETFYKQAYGSKDPEHALEEKEKGEKLSAKNLLDTFEVEPNNTPDKADWIFVGKDAYGKIRVSGDVDYWKVKAPKTGDYRIWLGEMPSNENYDLHLYTAEGREIKSSINSGAMDEVIDQVAFVKDEWYYIKIAGKGDSADRDGYYHIKIEYMAAGVIVMPDKYESNNLPANATEAQTDTVYQGTTHELGDIDYYKFQVDLASTLEFSLTNIPEGMDLDIYLFDSNQKQVAKSDKAKNADESIIYNGDPGYYYVKVVASKRSVLVHHEYKMEGVIRTIPVILIPGISGSRLLMKENGQVSEAWLDVYNMLPDFMIPIHRRVLALTPEKPGGIKMVQKDKGVTIFPEEVDAGLRGVEYLSYTEIDKVKNDAEQYYSMSEHLQKMGYQKGITLFGLPYDWRLSNVDNTKQLKKKIDEAISLSKAKQVQIVAHSMGGILTRETLLSNPSYQAKTKRVIYMGTPFLGSPRAYQAIQYGYNLGIPILNPETLRIISQYAPAVYELLPSGVYVNKEKYLTVIDSKGKKKSLTFNEILTNPKVQPFYVPLAKQAGKNHEKWDTKKINTTQYTIIGQGQATLAGYELVLEQPVQIPIFDQATGDGTVPFLSANHDVKDIKKKFYVNAEHAALPKNPYVIQQVAHLLLGIEKVQPNLSEKPMKNFAYNYYVIYREDGVFPEVTLSNHSKRVKLDGVEREFGNANVEYHGNVIVVHVPERGKQKYQLEMSSSLLQSEASEIIIEHFSSDGKSSRDAKVKRLRMQHNESLDLEP